MRPPSPPTLLPVGLGSHGGEFDKAFLDVFQRVVLRDQPVKEVLAHEAEDMQRVLNAARVLCALQSCIRTCTRRNSPRC